MLEDRFPDLLEALSAEPSLDSAAARVLALRAPVEERRYLNASLAMQRLDATGAAVDDLECFGYWAAVVLGEFEKRAIPRSRIAEALLHLAMYSYRTLDEIVWLLRADLPRGALGRWRS